MPLDIFSQLSLIIVVTAIITGLARIFKQPLVIGYILTGLILAPFIISKADSANTLSIFSEMGIAILLFIVGLHLSPTQVKDLGRTSFVIGFFQVSLTALAGFFISWLVLGFSKLASVYIGGALSFSSTIIVLKILSDRKDLEKLYGRLAIGILLIQDLVAILALIFASAFSKGSYGISTFGLLLVKGSLLLFGIFLISKFVINKLGPFFAKSQEYLTLFSIAWGFGLASLFKYFGFSIEIGALVAGIALSISPYSQEISSKLRPLRDFFVVMFFVVLGSQVVFQNLQQIWLPIVLFTIFTVTVKPFLIFFLMGNLGYNKKTAFYEGISLAQLSEFSLILALLGLKNGHLTENILAIIIVSAILSIAISSYLMMYIQKIYPFFAPYLNIFERKKGMIETNIVSSYDAVLFGCNRVGYDFIKVFKKLGSGFLAVDFDPLVIKELEKDGVNCIYGDAEDSEFLDDINITKCKVVISTIPDGESNQILLAKIRSVNKRSLVILLSYNVDEALKLYEKGASYVILPHFISGEFAADLAAKAGFDAKYLDGKKVEHIKYLQDRKVAEHSQPFLWFL